MLRTIAVLAILTAQLVASLALAEDFAARRDHNWHQWRGPWADGLAPHGDPPVEWSEQSNVAWKIEIPGEGSATPIVWEDRLFLLTAIKTERTAEQPPAADPTAKTQPPANYYQFVVLCLDRATGRELWRQVACEDVPHEGRHPTNTYASASPSTDGRRLVASFGSRGTFCYDLEGKLLWQRNLGRLRTRFGWGEGASPALHGESVVVNCDQEEKSFLEVLDVDSGETRWRAERDEPTSWATPLVVEHQGRVQTIVNGTNRVRSYDLATGEVLWQCGGQTVNAIPSPLAAGEVVYCMSGYRGAAACAIPLDAAGDITGTPVVRWRCDQGTPYVPSPILFGNQLYFTGGNTPVLSCLDAGTGKPVFERQRLPGLGDLYASPVCAAGRIYFTGRDGATTVIEHGNALKVLATNQLDERIDASPAIAGKQLFLRGAQHLYCLESATPAARLPSSPLERAVAFLAREVPQWHERNQCYSCHNNGDAARALYAASHRGIAIDPQALAGTTEWLTQPANWKHNGGEGPFNDKRLANIQFAWALLTAVECGAVENKIPSSEQSTDSSPLLQAAGLVASLQDVDGSWSVDAPGTIGSPATYGKFLATAASLRVLTAAGDRFAGNVDKARRWLRDAQPKTVLDAAATVLGLGAATDEPAVAQRQDCLRLIGQSQGPSGGWGPFAASPPEAFDTALALLALLQQRDGDRSPIDRGRRFLIACQSADGSWLETTRPAGAESYAQRISTTAWATLALLATE